MGSITTTTPEWFVGARLISLPRPLCLRQGLLLSCP